MIIEIQVASPVGSRGGLNPWRANLITELIYSQGFTCLRRQVSMTLNKDALAKLPSEVRVP